MKLIPNKTLKEITDFLGAKMVGDPSHVISGINEIHKVEPGDLVFVDHEKYYDKALNSKATTILIDKEVIPPAGKALIISDSPFNDFNKLTRHFKPTRHWSTDRNDNSRIDPSAVIYPGVKIGNSVTIGANSEIGAGVVLGDDTVIGDDVIIHANTVIGGDAFYYQKKEGKYVKMHSCGRVLIENDVEIGPLCTIDRGVTGDTIIGQGSKLDSQVHVGHDTTIGKNCLFAAQVGIAGCVIIEDEVTLWGQAGIPSNITIGKGTTVLGQSALMGSVEGGKTYLGSPATEAREAFRTLAMIRKLPKLFETKKFD